jgi:hypothetical protein
VALASRPVSIPNGTADWARSDLSRKTAGFDTPDLLEARALLDEL